MAKKPLYKRLKYGNILAVLVIVVFVIVMVSVIKDTKNDDNSSQVSAPVTESSQSGDVSASDDDSSTLEGQNIDTVLGKIDYTYDKYTKASMYDGVLAVVGAQAAFSGASASDCVSCYDFMFDSEGNKLFSIRDNSVTARSVTLNAVRSMMTDFCKQYGEAGLVLMNGYETGDSTSDLCTGYTVNFRMLAADGTYTDFSPMGSYQWLAENAYKYGLIFRYPQEKAGVTGVSDKTGYIRYVGQPHAQIMKNNNMCLEEYVEMLKNHLYENAVGYTTESGSDYAVYYCPSEGESTNIKVPTSSDGTKYNYEISGNNTDGFIVTAKLPDR